jgi:hypothetical protein
MSDFAKTTVAKSDQLNSEDLLGGPITVQITAVKVNLKEDQQPVSVSYKGDNNKPWKPSKTMRKVLMMKWGDDETLFVGRHLTLFRDPTITWAGQAVGGVSISHMSDMQSDERFMLASSRGQKKALKIEHLKTKSAEEVAQDKLNKASSWVSQSKLEISELDSADMIKKWEKKNAKAIEALGKYEDLVSGLTEFIKVSIADFETGKGEE